MDVNEERTVTFGEFVELIDDGGLYEIETPDGWVDIGCVFKKQNKTCYEIDLSTGEELKGSSDHYVETSDGWKNLSGIDIGDKVFTKTGIGVVSHKKQIGVFDTFDFEVKNSSHRYYSNDIVSHNTGKTAVVEGLAQRILKGDVPDTLKEKVIYSMDLGSLMAGTKMQGELEERVKFILDYIQAKDGQIMLFIDEIHNMVGMGSTNGVDVGNMLKPLLARGVLRCIGATTLDEYRENVEKDSALERRFQSIIVDQPDVDDTISILRGLKETYEVYHGVTVRDAALVAAAKLSHRYISDRFLPDKAIDLIDESCAMVRTELDSLPASLDDITRRIQQLEIEESALKNEIDDNSKNRLVIIVNELEEIRVECDVLMIQWEHEKSTIKGVNNLRGMLETAKKELDTCERNGVLERAGELKYSVIPKMETDLYEYEQALSKLNGGSMLHDAIDEDEIANVISRWTGIPLDRLTKGEAEKILNLDTELHKRLIGQEEAVTLVSQAMIRARSGIKDPKKPIGSFIFLGPTGVGKTELAKTLAESMFDSEQNIIRVDMSEYMERHTVSRLIGAPPGYVGFEDGGQLTEAVRRKPFSVILFDEIEKAHPDIFNVLLQILDDGRCTDGHGRTVNFKDTVIIMTSNIGSQHLLTGIDNDGQITEVARDKVMSELKTGFRPEFLNRVDDIILFKPLNRIEIKEIVVLCLNDIRNRLKERNIGLEITENAKEHVANISYDPVFGARPLKRYLTQRLETEIGKALLSGQVIDGQTITVDAQDDDIVISV